MQNQYLTAITPGSVELGPIPFDLYTKNTAGKMILFCRAGFEITPRQIGILHGVSRPFFIKSSDADAYADYAFTRLESIIGDTRMRISEKAEILHKVGKRSIRKLLEDPQSPAAVKQSEVVIGQYVELLLTSREAAPNLFALSAMDAYTYSHSVNVATLNMLLGERLFGSDRKALWEIGLAGLLHDIGKTMVNQRVLFKRGKLTPLEFAEVKRHAEFSGQIIAGHGYPEAIHLAGRNHHERWDGHGYPDSLEGPEMHLFARITAVSDVYDAITSRRVYKEERPHVDALREMSNEEGHFDADIFQILLQVVLQSETLVEEFKRSNLSDQYILSRGTLFSAPLPGMNTRVTIDR